MLATGFIRTFYKNIVKPVLFRIDAELAHDSHSFAGEFLGSHDLTRGVVKKVFAYENSSLIQTINGVRYLNPVGLSAGFDYDGHMAEIMDSVGFGFNTVGTVTAKYYEGNKKPRLGRLPKSKALFVNKGFKSDGCARVAEILDRKNLSDKTVGISVGSSNLPEIDSVEKAVADYTTTFEVFKMTGGRKYVKYFEVNISCPNTL